MNPTAISIPSNTWIKVATNITIGQIYLTIHPNHYYLVDYRLTGSTAPTDQTTAVTPNSTSIQILNSESIDVYVYCKNNVGGAVVSI